MWLSFGRVAHRFSREGAMAPDDACSPRLDPWASHAFILTYVSVPRGGRRVSDVSSAKGAGRYIHNLYEPPPPSPGLPIWAKNASAPFWISSGVRSCLWVTISHSWPKGSVTFP